MFCAFGLDGPLLAEAPPRTVRVSTIGHVGTPRSLTVGVEGAWRLIDLNDHRLLREGSGRAEWHFELGPGGLVRVRGECGQCEATGFRLEGVEAGQRFTVGEGRRARVYPGAVEVWPARSHAASGLRLINEAPMEEYLAGVVSAEGSASFQPEALKAIAIAARSYAEHNRGRHQPEGELCDTVHCQVYPGVGMVPEKVARAVADTAGIVALSGGEVIDAVFSADCGGRTRDSEAVWSGWGRIPYLRSVDDRPPGGGMEYCACDRSHTSRLKLTPDQIRRLLGQQSTAAGQVALAGLERDDRGDLTGLRLSISGDVSHGPFIAAKNPGEGRRGNGATGRRGDPVLKDGDELLPCELIEQGGAGTAPHASTNAPGRPATEVTATKAPSPPARTEAGPVVAGRLRASAAGDLTRPAGDSSRVTSLVTLAQLRHLLGDALHGRLVGAVPTPDGGVELECRGLGHGVGLCQWGAQGMALPPYNHTCDEILRHYYSGISLGPAPTRTARLSLELRGEGGQPLAGVLLRLLPGGPSGTTDSQGRWEAAVNPGTYSVEARRESATVTFFSVRVTTSKSAETRAALVWRPEDDRVARARTSSQGG